MKRRLQISTALSLRYAREGVAAEEFALLAPILILMFTGAASLGLASWTKMQVGNAARAGAVYAVNHGYNLASIITAAQSATALSNVTVTSALPTIQSCTDPTSGKRSSANGAKVCPGTGSPPGDYVTVTTQLSYSFILPIPGIAKTMTLRGTAVARIR